MKFDIITIFPNIFDSYFSESIIKRAQNKGLIKIKAHDLRDYTDDKHKTVDDKPFGGGAGMVVKLEPVLKAVKAIKLYSSEARTKVILFSAKGKKFDQKMARRFSGLDRLIMICGRYEGVDERVAKHIADYEISIGDYVLTGGELPAMVVIDAVTRLVPGVIKEESLREESFSRIETYDRKSSKALKSCSSKAALEYPQYTRPAIFFPKRCNNWRACPHKFCKAKFWRVPKVLLSGDHKKIVEWKKSHSS